jgi:hypothetical protein
MTQNLLPFNNFDKPGLQKLRHGVLPAGTIYRLKYRDRWPAGLRHQRFLLIPATVVSHFRRFRNMRKYFLTIMILLTVSLIKAQTSDFLTIMHIDSNKGIKNVNIIIPKLDTTLVTDTAGVVDLSGLLNIDTLIIKKFGYEKQIVTDNQRQIRIEKDTLIYSHDLKLLDLQHKDGFSFIKLRINGEIYWFKQKVGPLFLGNGRELETDQEYGEIFRNHKINKTVSVTSEYCLWRIRGESSANWITAIYYDPAIKKTKSNYTPGTSWYSKRLMRKDTNILKLEGGCLD